MDMRFLERNSAVQDGGLRLKSLWDELNPFGMLVYRRSGEVARYPQGHHPRPVAVQIAISKTFLGQ
jgi:hypothetical protein